MGRVVIRIEPVKIGRARGDETLNERRKAGAFLRGGREGGGTEKMEGGREQTIFSNPSSEFRVCLFLRRSIGSAWGVFCFFSCVFDKPCSRASGHGAVLRGGGFSREGTRSAGR